MRKITGAILAAAMMLAGCTQKTAAVTETALLNDGETVIWIASDLHYFSSELTDHGSLFTEMTEQADGKNTRYIEEITDAFLEEAAEAHPDALILSGDITFNGEKQSHLELAEKLQKLQDMGIAVLIIPGNHDIANGYARNYFDSGSEWVESVSSEEFADIYSSLGSKDAVSADPDSYSYLYDMNDTVSILFLDANTEENPGLISEKTLSWAEEQLDRCNAEGRTVFSVTHQNVMTQNMMIADGYVIKNQTSVKLMLMDHGVTLNMSGHIHAQHYAYNARFYDIASGSLAIAPHQYGVLTIDRDSNAVYKTQQTDVEGWAKKQGLGDEFADFAQESQDFFDANSRRKSENYTAALPISDTERQSMVDFAVQANSDFFSGILYADTDPTQEEAWALWTQYAMGTYWYSYMESIMDDPHVSFAELELNLKSE